MTWQNSFIETLGAFAKLVYIESKHGSCPPFSIVTDMVITERNRLIVQGNERLKRIEELEADVKNLRGCNSDLRDMVNEAYGKLDQSRVYGDDLAYQVRELVKALNDKDEQLLVAREFIEELIEG